MARYPVFPASSNIFLFFNLQEEQDCMSTNSYKSQLNHLGLLRLSRRNQTLDHLDPLLGHQSEHPHGPPPRTPGHHSLGRVHAEIDQRHRVAWCGSIEAASARRDCGVGWMEQRASLSGLFCLVCIYRFPWTFVSKSVCLSKTVIIVQCIIIIHCTNVLPSVASGKGVEMGSECAALVLLLCFVGSPLWDKH